MELSRLLEDVTGIKLKETIEAWELDLVCFSSVRAARIEC